jgi:predicted DNA-binding transcriptional regulator AlpA
MNRPFLDTEQLAEILPVTADALRYWRHIGRGPKHFRLGGKKVYYRPEDVDAWIDEQYKASNRPTHSVS